MLSRVLDVPVSFFFDDLDPVRAPATPGGFSEPLAEAFEYDPLGKRETIELVDAYSRRRGIDTIGSKAGSVVNVVKRRAHDAFDTSQGVGAKIERIALGGDPFRAIGRAFVRIGELLPHPRWPR